MASKSSGKRKAAPVVGQRSISTFFKPSAGPLQVSGILSFRQICDEIFMLSLLTSLMSSHTQVIDNVAVEHSAKKQRSAQKVQVAGSCPARADSEKVPPLSGKETTRRQRRTSPRQRASDRVESVKPGQELLGRRVRVFWAADQKWYGGSLSEYSAASGKHLCEYDDGDREWLDLAAEKYELDEGERTSVGMQ